METELDTVKSTITITLGTKNRIRKLKGDLTYEDYINKLLDIKESLAHKNDYIEYQKHRRKKAIISLEEFQIMFSYNAYTDSPNHIFDITLQKIRNKGIIVESVKFRNYLKGLPLKEQYELYFEMLRIAIKKEKRAISRRKVNFADYYNWKRLFERLNLSKKAFDEDVMERLHDYEQGTGAFE